MGRLAKTCAVTLLSLLIAAPIFAQDPTFRPEDITLALTDVAPEQIVTITNADMTFAAYLIRNADGALVLEWGKNLGDIWFYSDGDLILVTKLPPGDYTVASWSEQSRTVGKTSFIGAGLEQKIAVGEEMIEASMQLTKERGVRRSLPIIWAPYAPPNGVFVYADGVFIGIAFDSAEARVGGLDTGAHEIRLVAPGYEPITTNLVVTDVETPLFVRFTATP